MPRSPVTVRGMTPNGVSAPPSMVFTTNVVQNAPTAVPRVATCCLAVRATFLVVRATDDVAISEN